MPNLNVNDLYVCQSLQTDPAICAFQDVFYDPSPENISLVVSLFIEKAETLGLRGNVIREYALYLLTRKPNLVSETVEKNRGSIGTSLHAAFVHDIEIIEPMISDYDLVSTFPLISDYQPTLEKHDEPELFLENMLSKVTSYDEIADALIAYYCRYGYGDLAAYRAFRWHDEKQKLVGIEHFDPIRFFDLVGYESQKELLRSNTRAFVDGKPANNVLLIGARGTGKSSSVKALINEFYPEGLRLLQLNKPQLKDLAKIFEMLREFPSKRFIIFLDDLSFEREDPEFKFLKSAIEGGASIRPENVLIYATSNRRHLIREDLSDRNESSGELYRDDSANETISLADRFGLIVHYYAPDQDEFFAIIRHMLAGSGIDLDDETLRVEALRWEMTHSGRNGRTAQQFVTNYIGQLKNS